jgi:cation transport ATPase
MITSWYLQKLLKELGTKHGDNFNIPSQEALVKLAKLKLLIFPSTAFFYEGNPQLSQFFALQDQTMGVKQQVLQLAAGLANEATSIAFSPLVTAAKSMDLVVRETEVDQIAPMGLLGKLDRTWYILGDEACMNQEGIELGVSVQTLARQFQQEGKYSLFLAQKQPKRLLGVFSCFYPINSLALNSIEDLHKQGVSCSLVTGLKRSIAQAVAKQLGITDLESEVSGKAKDLAIEGLKLQQPDSGVCLVISKRKGGITITLGPELNVWVKSLQELPVAVSQAQLVVKKLKQRLFWVTLD